MKPRDGASGPQDASMSPPQVIDLISSSPSPPASPPPPSRAPGGATESEAATTATEGARRRFAPGPRPAEADLRGLSDLGEDDDFDFLAAHEDAPRKRRRGASPAPDAAAPLSRPPLLAGATGASLHRRVFDPIEVSSSMEQPSPGALPLALSTAAAARISAAPVAAPAAHPESDPFASSPRAPPAVTAPAAHPESDPFASSPRAPPAVTVPAIRLESDPFISSPNAPRSPAKSRSRQLGRRAVSLDPFVSSSSPAATTTLLHNRSALAQPSSPAAVLHQRRHGPSLSTEPTRGPIQAEVVCIDSDSAASSDSDLPDILGIGPPARPSTRVSSFRRVQSDTIRPALPPRVGPSSLAESRPVVGRRRNPAATAAAKEQKKREREQAKEARAREKARAAALAEANKLRTDKKVSTPEMIVDLPSALTPECRAQAELILQELGVEHTTWETAHRVVKWRRKVTSRFDDDTDRWEPVAPRVDEEPNVLAIVTADEFVDLALGGGLAAHVGQVRQRFARHQVLYLVQGMTAWMRKNRNLRNRQFASSVRATTQAPPRRGREAAAHVPEEQVEDALLRLQVEHGVLIHHTAAAVETARWVATFTQHISTAPYRRQREHAMSAAGFCMESGQVRTGEGAGDTYVRMLQEIVRITAPVAYGVAAEFGSVGRLVRGLEEGGPARLEGIRRSANAEGLASDRAIGQAVSRRMYKIFTGRDEMSTEV